MHLVNGNASRRAWPIRRRSRGTSSGSPRRRNGCCGEWRRRRRGRRDTDGEVDDPRAARCRARLRRLSARCRPQARAVPARTDGQEHWSAAPRSNTGDGLRLGEQVGGKVDTSLAAPGAWAPVSLVPQRDGSFGHFPHLVERAKPGFIAVPRRAAAS